MRNREITGHCEPAYPLGGPTAPAGAASTRASPLAGE